MSTNPQRRSPPAWDWTRPAAVAVLGDELLVQGPNGVPIRLPRPTPYIYPSGAAVTVAANTTTRLNVRFRADAGFVWTDFRLRATAAGSLLVRIIDEAAGREYMDAPIVANLISGTSNFPYVLPVASFQVPNATLGFELTDTSGAGNEVQFACYGFKLGRPGAIGMVPVDDLARQTPFWHRLTFTVPAGAGTGRVQQVITVQHAAEFHLVSAQADVNAGYDVTLRSASGGVQYSQDFVAAETVFGSGQQPGNFAAPFVFPPREDIVLEALNRTAGGIAVRGCLAGKKVWS
jgi:hypothetical protein